MDGSLIKLLESGWLPCPLALWVMDGSLIKSHLPLCSEQEILREEITCLQTSKERLKKRVSDLEEEVKKYKEELDKALKRASAQPEDEV